MKYDGKVKLAIFDSNTKFSWRMIYEESQTKDTTYVRVSEWIEVEFPPVAQDTLIQLKIEALDKAIESKKAETMEEIKVLMDYKQELLAIGFDKLDKDANELLVDD